MSLWPWAFPSPFDTAGERSISMSFCDSAVSFSLRRSLSFFARFSVCGNRFSAPQGRQRTISTSAHGFLPPRLSFLISCELVTPGLRRVAQRLHSVRFNVTGSRIWVFIATSRRCNTHVLEILPSGPSVPGLVGVGCSAFDLL